ncbi:MAG: SIMPL domain-containing protein [Candidatus Azambacteria bacterium]|nr:SIMPL domain-containing protein [Candidatus Azambacteria bacterium]
MVFDYNKLPKLEQKVVLITFVILALFLVFSGYKQLIDAVNNYRNGGSNNSPQMVSFTGEGKVKATPDTAKVEIGLITEGKDSISVQNENSSKMNAVIKFLKEQKISGEDIKTSAYNLSPKYEYNKGKSTLVGYILNQSLTITIRDLNKIGGILDGAVSNGANQINSISLFVDKPEELKNKAREDAVKQAKEKASDAAKIAGFRLGRLVNFSENLFGEPRIYSEALGMGGSATAPAPQIEPGTQEITIRITLTYLIK